MKSFAYYFQLYILEISIKFYMTEDKKIEIDWLNLEWQKLPVLLMSYV